MKITGQHPAEDLLLSASMPQSTDLRQIGLVDDIVEKPEDGGPRADSGVESVFAVYNVYRPNVFIWLLINAELDDTHTHTQVHCDHCVIMNNT